MPDGIYRVAELMGSSSVGASQTIGAVGHSAAQTLRKLDRCELVDLRNHVDVIAENQVTVEIGSRLDEGGPVNDGNYRELGEGRFTRGASDAGRA